MTNEEYKFFISRAYQLIESSYVQDLTPDELAEKLYQVAKSNQINDSQVLVSLRKTVPL